MKLLSKVSKGVREGYTMKGFTLVELLVVIAIIGILSSVVFASLSASRTKASRAAALATGRSIMPELSMCATDNGSISSPDTTSVICTAAGHAVLWPGLPKGWTYGGSAGSGSSDAKDETFQFILTAPAGSTDVTCTMVTNSCN